MVEDVEDAVDAVDAEVKGVKALCAVAGDIALCAMFGARGKCMTRSVGIEAITLDVRAPLPVLPSSSTFPSN